MTFPPDWFEMPEDQAIAFEDELRRECMPGHVLHGLEVRAVAVADWSDDSLFEIEDGRWAKVHLTWKAETDPKWPATEIFKDFEAVLKRLHAEFAERMGDEPSA